MAATDDDLSGARRHGDQGAAPGPGDALISGAIGDRCASCGVSLASDQRYCVECGQRRGKSRFSVTGQSAPASPPPPRKRRRRLPGAADFPGATMVAFIATLLLAMGVGVEIGHSGKTTTTKASAAAPEVITVAGGSSSSGNSSNTGTVASSKKGKAKAKKATTKVTKKVVQQANNAASKQLGTSAKNLVQNPTEQQGQSCSGGAGCQNGKFTGSFFGGG